MAKQSEEGKPMTTEGHAGERCPKRIQRKRMKGWKMPPNTVYVGRPTKFGNPFLVGPNGKDWSREEVVAMYRKWAKEHGTYAGIEAVMNLRGKDLACWCPLIDENGNRVPCHADVLLEIANA
jgi:hypothetical protein